MGAREAKDWSFFGKVMQSSVSQTNTYQGQQFANDFANLPAQTQAVIVSGDPFFTSKASDLVAAASKWAKPVCYPNEIYTAAKPLQGASMVYGPDLSTAYTSLGQKAADYLTANVKPSQAGLDSPHPSGPNYI
jgi:hypothetical protein